MAPHKTEQSTKINTRSEYIHELIKTTIAVIESRSWFQATFTVTSNSACWQQWASHAQQGRTSERSVNPKADLWIQEWIRIIKKCEWWILLVWISNACHIDCCWMVPFCWSRNESLWNYRPSPVRNSESPAFVGQSTATSGPLTSSQGVTGCHLEQYQ